MFLDRPVAFLLVDLNTQNDYFAPEAPLALPNAAASRRHIGLLARAALHYGIPILSGCDEHKPDDPEFRDSRLPPHCLAGTPGAAKIFETLVRGAPAIPHQGRRRPWPNLKDLRERGGEVILEKDRFDLFTNPACGEVIRAINPQELVVFGAMLEHDILSTALTARTQGLAVSVVGDATAYRDADAAHAARLGLQHRGVRLEYTEETLLRIATWKHRQERRRRTTRSAH
jgi:nicotinamidase-related amidase